jgi:hypothetical protein
MKSTLNVEFDFDSNEPYIQLSIDDTITPNVRSDMRDAALLKFVEKGNINGISVYWPDPVNKSQSFPQLRLNSGDKELSKQEQVIDARESIKLNHIKINAQYQQSYGADSEYKNGESYNLMFAIGENNHVVIEYGGAVVMKGDTFRMYLTLSQFLKFWTVN